MKTIWWSVLMAIFAFGVIYLYLEIKTPRTSSNFSPGDSSSLTEEKIEDAFEEESEEINYKIALVADIHLNRENLRLSLDKAEQNEVDLILVLGDITDYSSTEFLRETRTILDNLETDYLVMPGDRDIIKDNEETTIEETNFSEIFEDKICYNHQLAEYKILCLSNPYNFNTISESYLNETLSFTTDYKVLISSQPIYNPVSNVYMGFNNEELNEQRKRILKELIDKDLAVFISGDTHFYSTYTHQGDDSISFYTLGALTETRNIQRPNFAILTSYIDGDFEVDRIYLED